MAKVCEICARSYLKGNQRSHSNRATIKRQYTNLQSAVIDGQRLRVCTRCVRTSVKVKA